jgi:hypothetical protein
MTGCSIEYDSMPGLMVSGMYQLSCCLFHRVHRATSGTTFALTAGPMFQYRSASFDFIGRLRAIIQHFHMETDKSGTVAF